MPSFLPPPSTVYLARHGQSEWNHTGRITGQADIGLSEVGQAQSLALARCLEGVPLSAIYCSALQRTAATAAPTAATAGLAPQPLAALNEIGLGVLQGRYRDERDPQAQALWAAWQADPWGATVPGGERMDDLVQRAVGALRQILQRHAGQSVLIVGHRATNRVLLATLLGWPREAWSDIRLRNKFFYRLRLGDPPEVASFALSGRRAGICQEGLVM